MAASERLELPRLSGLRAGWRRSLQGRVVTSTMLASTLVVALVGWTLLRQVTDGLVESKQQTSLQEAARGFAFAQDTLDGADPTDLDPGLLLTELLDSFSARGAGSELYQVSISGPVTDLNMGPAGSGWRSLGEVDEVASVPPALWSQVVQGPGSFWTYTGLRYDGAGPQTTVPALAVGSQLQMPSDGGTYLMFYFFPLEQQQQTLGLVRAALITAGLLLVLLVGVVAFLVARQVVTPVRLARRIAERLAAGRLEERMHVRGEDDIARLAMSFNQMAANLQQQIRQLEDLSRVQRRFVSDVSHELRTPLTTVRMAADVLHEARATFDGATARSAELLQAELDRFELLLSDLLEISRFDAGVAGLELDEVDLTDVANGVAESMRALADLNGSKLIVSAPGYPCTAEADVRRIERIVRNLVANAIDYGEGRPIVITVAASQDAAAIAVRDRGVGLRPEEVALVFNRFWRADPARARTTGGTGLGLAISQEDARLHGGWLQAWGELGAGTQFRLTLPRRAGGRLERSPLPLVPSDASRLMSSAGQAGRGPVGTPVGSPYARVDVPSATTELREGAGRTEAARSEASEARGRTG